MEEITEKEELQTASLNDLFKRLSSLKKERGTLWFGITGSWRKTSGEIEKEVRKTIRKIIERGDGMVSGGALNVDYFALDEVLIVDPKAEHVKIFIPVTLDLYAAHYWGLAQEGVITIDQAEALIALLKRLKKINPSALIENSNNTIIDQKTYFERNTDVVTTSDALIGFQVNESEGVGDTVSKALSQRKPVYVQKYNI